jgi:hypothetical protein
MSRIDIARKLAEVPIYKIVDTSFLVRKFSIDDSPEVLKQELEEYKAYHDSLELAFDRSFLFPEEVSTEIFNGAVGLRRIANSTRKFMNSRPNSRSRSSGTHMFFQYFQTTLRERAETLDGIVREIRRFRKGVVMKNPVRPYMDEDVFEAVKPLVSEIALRVAEEKQAMTGNGGNPENDALIFSRAVAVLPNMPAILLTRDKDYLPIQRRFYGALREAIIELPNELIVGYLTYGGESLTLQDLRGERRDLERFLHENMEAAPEHPSSI